MVQAKNNASPVSLTSYSQDSEVDQRTKGLLQIMIKSCKPMIYKG